MMTEPKWLEEKRAKAAALFSRLELPAGEEYWRRANLSRLKLAEFSVLPRGGAPSPLQLDDTVKRQGVILKPLERAVVEDEPLVKRYLGSGFAGLEEKFLAQNEAGWQSGMFCRVPRGVRCETPVFMTTRFTEGGKALFPRLLVILEKGAEAFLVHHTVSECPEGALNYANSVVEIYVGEEASLTFVELQEFSERTHEIARKRVELEAGAKCKWVMSLQGAKTSKTDVEAVLKGNGAETEVDALLCASGKQHLELFSRMHHVAPRTRANILVKASAREKAKTIFQGMIRIEKEAQQTDSFMRNNNLLLSETAHCDSIPRLEIEADDVRASHGATIGHIDPEQLFYLRSKGIRRTLAEELLIQGFYDEIFGRIPKESVREIMRKSLERKEGRA